MHCEAHCILALPWFFVQFDGFVLGAARHVASPRFLGFGIGMEALS